MNPTDFVRMAAGWIGTPFADHGRSRGGVDCVGLAILLYQQAGVLGQIEVPRYTLDGGYFAKGSPLAEVVERLGWATVWNGEGEPQLQIGDLLTMRLGRIPFHCGIAIGPQTFVHAHPTSGVIQGDLRDWTFKRRLQAIYRP